MVPAMCPTISQVVCRTVEIKERTIGVHFVNTQITDIVHRINRTEKIIQCHKPHILGTGQNPAQVIVPFVQITIISIKRI